MAIVGGVAAIGVILLAFVVMRRKRGGSSSLSGRVLSNATAGSVAFANPMYDMPQQDSSGGDDDPYKAYKHVGEDDHVYDAAHFDEQQKPVYAGASTTDPEDEAGYMEVQATEA